MRQTKSCKVLRREGNSLSSLSLSFLAAEPASSALQGVKTNYIKTATNSIALTGWKCLCGCVCVCVCVSASWVQGVSNNGNNNNEARPQRKLKKVQHTFWRCLNQCQMVETVEAGGPNGWSARNGQASEHRQAALPATRNGECEWRIAPAANYCASLSLFLLVLLLLLWHSHVACTKYPGLYSSRVGSNDLRELEKF